MIKNMDATYEDEKKKIVSGKRNVLAMEHLKMALVKDSLWNKVNIVGTCEWPGGLANDLIELMKKEYQPQD